jgi:hypothetical protein
MKLLAVIISILLAGCYIFPDPGSSSDFYQNYSDWDISYVPIIDPIRVGSIDKGRTWIFDLGLDVNNGGEVASFGVSGNFIYGLRGDCRNCKDNWFLYDVNTRLWATYRSLEEVWYTLKYFGAAVNEINPCDNYFRQLINQKRCYWYPPPGSKYSIDTTTYLKNLETLSIVGDTGSAPKLMVNLTVNANKTHIHFYRISIQKGLTDSLYIGVDNRYDQNPPYYMAKDGMVLPVHAPLQEYKLTLYSPFLTAQRRHFSENIFDTVIVRRINR